VLVSRVLADKLGARTGDRVQVRVDTAGQPGAAPVDLRVAGITRTEVPGGYMRLVGLSVTEGALYSLAAGVVGTAVGAAAGRLVAARFGRVFAAYAGSEFDWKFSFSLKASTLAAAFIAGTVLTLAVIFLASRRTARMTIVAAIRDLPEPPAGTRRRPWVRRVRLAIPAAVGGVALVRPYFPRLAGGIVLIVVLSSLARPRLSPRTHATLTGLALAGWSLAMIGTSDPNADPGAFIGVFVVALLTAVFGLTILAAANLHIAETTVGVLGGASPGQKLTLQGQDGPVTLTIVGSQPFGLLDGMFGTEPGLAPFRAAPLGATMLLDIRDTAQADAVARTVERGLFAHGVDADSVQTLLDQADRANRALLSVIDALMRMGLVVGILGLRIVALRAVTERRHVIGILRAIGYKRRSVILALLTESAVTATIGTAVGTAAGVAMGYLLYRQSDAQPGFGIDLASVGGVLGLIYLAVLLVTLGPAWRASRLPPADAVRHTE